MQNALNVHTQSKVSMSKINGEKKKNEQHVCSVRFSVIAAVLIKTSTNFLFPQNVRMIDVWPLANTLALNTLRSSRRYKSP